MIWVLCRMPPSGRSRRSGGPNTPQLSSDVVARLSSTTRPKLNLFKKSYRVGRSLDFAGRWRCSKRRGAAFRSFTSELVRPRRSGFPIFSGMAVRPIEFCVALPPESGAIRCWASAVPIPSANESVINAKRMRRSWDWVAGQTSPHCQSSRFSLPHEERLAESSAKEKAPHGMRGRGHCWPPTSLESPSCDGVADPLPPRWRRRCEQARRRSLDRSVRPGICRK